VDDDVEGEATAATWWSNAIMNLDCIVYDYEPCYLGDVGGVVGPILEA
jgi:hypothetical protein